MEAHAHTGEILVRPSRKPIVAALIALLVGGTIATGIWWLTDNDVSILPEPATKVIVAQPGTPGAGTAAKDEAATAAAVGAAFAPSRPAADQVPQPGEQHGGQYGTSQYRVDASTGLVTKEPPATRYDGGPEEGSAEVISGARP